MIAQIKNEKILKNEEQNSKVMHMIENEAEDQLNKALKSVV